MPAHDGLRFHNHQDLGPPGPHAAQDSPEQPVPLTQPRTRPLPLEHRDLLPQGEDLQGSVMPTAKEDSNSGQKSKNEFEHELTLVTWRNVASAAQRLRTASC